MSLHDAVGYDLRRSIHRTYTHGHGMAGCMKHSLAVIGCARGTLLMQYLEKFEQSRRRTVRRARAAGG